MTLYVAFTRNLVDVALSLIKYDRSSVTLRTLVSHSPSPLLTHWLDSSLPISNSEQRPSMARDQRVCKSSRALLSLPSPPPPSSPFLTLCQVWKHRKNFMLFLYQRSLQTLSSDRKQTPDPSSLTSTVLSSKVMVFHNSDLCRMIALYL
jgi:hypothetical protein